MKRVLRLVLLLSLGATCLQYILGLFGRHSWALDMFSHFRWQYFLILLIGTSLFLFIHRKFWFVFLPFVVALSIDMAPFYLDSTQRKAPSETVKIVCINVLSSNGNFDAVENYLKEKDPDLIVLQEFTTLWQLMIGPKLTDYSYRLEIPTVIIYNDLVLLVLRF